MESHKALSLNVEEEVILLFNNVLIAKANNERDLTTSNFLTETQKEWIKIAEQHQESVKIYISNKYADKIDPNQFAKVAYPDPADSASLNNFASKASIEFPIVISPEQLLELKKQGFFAPDYSKDRAFTKYRVIVSKVPILNADGTVDVITVITACAPNLMGTSEWDKKEFIDADGNLKQKEYEEACQEIANLIAFAVKDNNIESVKIADFGLGAYLHRFKKDEKFDQINLARNIMYSAFKKAAETYEVKIDWIIFKDESRAKQLSEQYPSKCISFSDGDIINGMTKWSRENSINAVVNNGSDRTICGKFTTSRKTATTEEQLGKNTLIFLIQTILNPVLHKNVCIVDTAKGEIVGKPVIAPYNPETYIQPEYEKERVKNIVTEQSTASENKTNLAEEKKFLETISDISLKEVTLSALSGREPNLKITFQNSEDPEKFTLALFNRYQVGSCRDRYNPKPKSVIVDNNEKVVYVTEKEMKILRDKQKLNTKENGSNVVIEQVKVSENNFTLLQTPKVSLFDNEKELLQTLFGISLKELSLSKENFKVELNSLEDAKKFTSLLLNDYHVGSSKDETKSKFIFKGNIVYVTQAEMNLLQDKQNLKNTKV